ncbi:GTPase Era [Rurimicrobium arvi]|uniref:GTPase Era n=2 Tax=Rurimicrobium arvi TaxID=2049916 RepID=A0ABP8MZT7_9BACT
MSTPHKAGFVNIFGAPNAGKSTLLNALLGEYLVITSPKVQTTRHRILGILTEPGYQIVFSDTPGIIEPKYALHRKMMMQVKSALEDADVAVLMHDITQPMEEIEHIDAELKLKVPVVLLLNKADLIKDTAELQRIKDAFQQRFPNYLVETISAAGKKNLEKIIPFILEHLPEAPPFYPEDSMSDRSTRFFVSELIREQIYHLFKEEIPYHAAVLIRSYEEKTTLDVIKADIIVTRETQKVILIGKGGTLIKKLGIEARKKIEEFVGRKVHLELFVKVRPKWRDTDTYLSEYGYN